MGLGSHQIQQVLFFLGLGGRGEGNLNNHTLDPTPFGARASSGFCSEPRHGDANQKDSSAEKPCWKKG